MSLFYCMQCRSVSDRPAQMCPRCPDEPLINVSDPANLQDVDDLERSQVFRHSAKWQAAGAIALGLVGGALSFVLFALLGLFEHDYSYHSSSGGDPGAGGYLLIAPFAGFGLLGAALGSRISKRLRRCDGPTNVHQAIERFENRQSV